MARLTKNDLLDALKELGIEGDPKASNEKLEKQLKKAEKAAAKEAKEGEGEDAIGDGEEDQDSVSDEDDEGRIEPGAEGEDSEEAEDTGDDDGSGERLQSSPKALPEEEVEVDYLRQYQYRKQTVFGSVDSDPQPDTKASIMKAQLLKQPKVRIFIPRSAGESPTIKMSVNLNGYRLDFPKQAYLDMPQQVAEVVMDSLSQTEEALLRGQITGDSEKEKALL